MNAALEKLKAAVCAANLELVRNGLVILTWGNVSGIDREAGLVVIKPSGVSYDEMTPRQMVVVRMSDGEVMDREGLKPSSDTPTHLALYRAFPKIGGVAHTHSPAATAFAQAMRELPCLGTTHADHFYGAVPVTDPLTDAEIRDGYEANTGEAIVRRLRRDGRDPMAMPAVLVSGHGPFTWGRDAAHAAENSRVLEECARMARDTLLLHPGQAPLSQTLLDKHFLRKHGAGAYYGQSPGKTPNS